MDDAHVPTLHRGHALPNCTNDSSLNDQSRLVAFAAKREKHYEAIGNSLIDRDRMLTLF